MHKAHELKLHKRYFWSVASGIKAFELRFNDRNYKVGDILILKEWDGLNYSGNEISAKIIYILNGSTCNGLQDNYVILSIRLLTITISQ